MTKLNVQVARMREVLRRKHYSFKTEKNYIQWLRRYCEFIGSLDSDLSSETKLEIFLSSLAKSGVSASTQNQAFNAILFHYRHVLGKPLEKVDALRAIGSTHERTAPTRGEVSSLLDIIEDRNGYPVRLIVRMLYGCGLRVSEPLNLRIKDIDIEHSRIIVRGAKGGKDRVVGVPCQLMTELLAQVEIASALWERDRLNSLPVELPCLLAKKFPDYQFARPWAFVFPAHKPCPHPRTGQIVRFRLHEANIQRAVRDAAQKLGLRGKISPHNLRHSYATHLLDAGTPIHDLRDVMGHVDIRTTAGYGHGAADRVPSPLTLNRKCQNVHVPRLTPCHY